MSGEVLMIGDQAAEFTEFTELLKNIPENFNVKSVNEGFTDIGALQCRFYTTPCKILNLKVSN